jgi:YebC/PmpR family DNA-binding regulatory protein
MAGHSQFKNIMYRKGAQDAKRAKKFQKLTREIIVSVKSGQPDPAMNPRLRSALAAARAANMPKDNIDRAIKKALGEGDTANYEEIRYEGYGPGGVAVIVESLTDNRNRTAPEVRSTFSKYGGNLGETGSVSFSFEHLGSLQFSNSVASFDDLFEKAVEAGAQNIEENGDCFEVLTSVDDFGAVRDALTSAYGDPVESGIIWRPVNKVAVDEDTAKSLLKMIDVLEDNDDVQNVYANFDISDDILEKLSS